MKVKIHIKLKQNILDIEGKTIENSIKDNFGFKNISNIRKGKLIEINIKEDDKHKIDEIIKDICDKILVNQVMEEYEILQNI